MSMHQNPWVAMRSLTRDGEVASASSRPGTIPRIAKFARPYRREIIVFLVLVIARRAARRRAPAAVQGDHRRGIGTNPPAAGRPGRDRVALGAGRRLALVDAGPDAVPAVVLSLAGRRGPDLRPAHQGVRPRAADAGRVLHPHPDRCAGQPAEHRRASAPSRRSPRRCRRWSPTSSASSWCSPRCSSCPGRSPSARWCCAAVPAARPAGSAAGCRRITREAMQLNARHGHHDDRAVQRLRRAAGQAVRPAADDESTRRSPTRPARCATSASSRRCTAGSSSPASTLVASLATALVYGVGGVLAIDGDHHASAPWSR